jgi:LCP family protein required for cell wall assembly
MRTTLKRGIGRGADVNGNGRAVTPPGVLTSVTRYRQPPRPGHGVLWWMGRAFLWLFVALLMASGAFAGGIYLYEKDATVKTAPRRASTKKAAKRLNYVDPGKPAVALVIGYDHRATDPSDAPPRSDTIMLLRTDPGNKTISMLSLPRDLRVEIHCPGKPTWAGKINAAYMQCRESGTLETVRSVTGLPINYLITVNFVGFVKMVDKMGGVWIDVDRRYHISPHAGVCLDCASAIDLQPGYQHLTGKKALDFVRYRHTDNDLYRNARQQLFVKALKERVNSLSLGDIPSLVGILKKNVEIGRAGGKGIDPSTLNNYAKLLYDLPGGHFFQARIQGLEGTSDLYTASSNITAAVEEFLHPDVEAPEKATEVALGQRIRPRKRRIAPSKISLVVLNGTTSQRPGAAADAGYLLAQRGYHILVPPNNLTANAPRFEYTRTTIYYHPSRPLARLAAEQVAKLFPNGQIQAMTPELAPYQNGPSMVVVIGETFHNNLAPVPVDRTPKKQPPFTRRDPWATRSLLLGARRKVGFKLEIPTVLERNSRLTTQTPIRIYKVGNHPALRLTFNMGLEYWGIQMTNWADAPVLANKNFRHRIGRRVYDFYYSGPHLHMIVLRENRASYWVVNTLLDSLSNETMIAIARGLRPLSK